MKIITLDKLKPQKDRETPSKRAAVTGGLMGRRVVVVTHSSPSLKRWNPANWDSCLGKVKTNMLLKKPGADIQFSGTSMITHRLLPAPCHRAALYCSGGLARPDLGITGEGPPLPPLQHLPLPRDPVSLQGSDAIFTALGPERDTGGHGTRYAFCRTFPFKAV